MSCPITPRTKVADLLDAYPRLEEVLVAQSPHFTALGNPVLRKMVAKVATLEKAAQMAGIPVRRLVAVLRDAAGLPPGEALAGERAPDEDGLLVLETPPDWVRTARIRTSLDADRLLEAGRVPLVSAQQAAGSLAGGELLCIQSTFRPTPLIEALEARGFRTCIVQAAPDTLHTYVARLPA